MKMIAVIIVRCVKKKNDARKPNSNKSVPTTTTAAAVRTNKIIDKTEASATPDNNHSGSTRINDTATATSSLPKSESKLSTTSSPATAPSAPPAAAAPLVPKRAADSLSQCLEWLSPEHCISAKIAYGGQIMSWIDICGGMACFKHCGGFMVTASMDPVHFVAPAKMDQIVRIRAKVLRAFGTSMEVKVIVEAEDYVLGKVYQCCSALLVYVAIGPDKKPIPVAPLVAETEEEKRDYKEAEGRREARKAWKETQRKVGAAIASRNYTMEELYGFLAESKLPGVDTTPTPVTRKLSSNILSDTTIAPSTTSSTMMLSTAPANSHASLATAKPLPLFDGKTPITCEATRIELTEIVMPQHANPLGITFGGQLMKWMETAGTICASRLARAPCATACVDEMLFASSSKVGDALIFKAQINRVYGTSLEVGVRCEVLSLRTPNSASTSHCSTAYFTFIAVDPTGFATAGTETSPTTFPPTIPILRKPLPQVLPSNDDDKKRWVLAGARRDRRLATRVVPASTPANEIPQKVAIASSSDALE